MENNTKKYYNRSALTGAERAQLKDYKVLKMRFSAYDADAKEQVSKWFTMFLTEENNDKNREILLHLGVENPPEVVSHDTIGDLNGLGLRTVDLVAETNDAGYENIKFINEPKFGQRVFDAR